ncbi:stalk domain-containing protein [Paenibacillus sedimenti]|uniref:Carboxypeptidase regulatory-like domain-containing protein n=1 Tax=Paenibacillus sedimenti TaxID=2770274 RepID=A0A926KL09_9BACL|nr:stalk domain-containing protein [Paenibacillus sedimenti]MBD0378931.1 carboxypeptidase regulatory-like domain-containing protein [Paenibacillus sedimenti]
MKKFSAFKILSVFFFGIALFIVMTWQSVFAASNALKVYFNGDLLKFEDAHPVIRDGNTLVPFRQLFETLGFQVNWSDKGGVRKATGAKDGLEIELTLDSLKAMVNGEAVDLEVPAQILNGKTMVPLRFVSENSGYEVMFADSGSGFVINIEGNGANDGGMQNSSNEMIESGIVKGRVSDAQGNPIKGAEVVADNQLLYNSNAIAVTDADGYYRIPLGMRATTWLVSARITRPYNGESYTFNLISDNDKPFASDDGAIRNFTWNASGTKPEGCYSCQGKVLFYMMDLINPKGSTLPPPNREDVEITLIPEGTIIDGSPGQVITGNGTNSPDGFGIQDVPLGRYTITARFMPEGEEPVQMMIRKVREDKYSDSLTTDFTSITSGINRIEIELKLP